MAQYEYHCQSCDRGFEVQMRPQEVGKTPVSCPGCKSEDVQRVYTAFFAKTQRKS